MLEGFLSRRRARVARRFIPENAKHGKLLDIGCGSNPFFLRSVEVDGKYGIDPNTVSNSGDGINLIKANIETNRIPFSDNFFDVVTMLAVIEHINPHRLPHVLEEIKRVLKKDGRFIMTTPSPWIEQLRILQIMASLNLVSAEEIMEHKYAYSHKAINDFLKRTGFTHGKIKNGYFEMFVNSWTYVDK